MTGEWHFQYPSTSVSTSLKGDRVYAQTFHGEGQKLLYQLKNNMKFQKLGQLKMTRFFTDGTVITAKSHFGYDSIEIDVSKAVVAEISCTITLIDLPDVIAPMKYSGQIFAGEVEGVDYIKTYYTVDTEKCDECTDDPDFTVCDTTELTANESICTPFKFTDNTIPLKTGELDNHCVTSTSHCQAEIISFGEDGEGTYFLWKGYTEWGEDFTRSGLGYMVLRGFFTKEGQVTEVCNSGQTVIRVDCCEKYEDAYETVHPELEDLDIEYTSLTMGCGQQQTLTAEYGCSPFIWTLVSGGGTLTPAEDTLTAVYESPETNPDCANNPTIELEDRCENTKELKLVINCNPEGVAYWQTTYEQIGTDPFGIGLPQCSHVVTYYDCDGLANDSIYNPCVGDNLYPCDGTPCSGIVAPLCRLVGCDFRSHEGSCGEFGNYPGCTEPSMQILCFSCSKWAECPDNYYQASLKECSDCAGDADGDWPYTGIIDYHGHACDKRTQVMKDAGCCPINPETGLAF